MIQITLITWGGAQCAVAHTANGLRPFLERITKVQPARTRATLPISVVRDATLRNRWSSTAQACGACWAVGMAAATF